MNDAICPNAELAERLVDYADGELPFAEATLVKDHLACCAVCRRELAALTITINAAHREWQSMPVPRLDRVPRKARAPHLGPALRISAAALLIAAYGGAAWWFLPPLFRTHVVVVADPENQPLEPAPIETFVAELNQEASAARLIASAEILANQPGAEEHAARSLRFIVDVYPRTKAGLEAARRLADNPALDELTPPN